MRHSLVSLSLFAASATALAAANLNWLPPEAVTDPNAETTSDLGPAVRGATPPPTQMLTPNTVSADIAAMMRSMRKDIQRVVGATTQPSSAAQALTVDERLLREYIARGKPLTVDICSSTIDSTTGPAARGGLNSRTTCLVNGVSIGGPRGN